MNYLKLTGITVVLWGLSAWGVYSLWGKMVLQGVTYGALACLAATVAGEMARLRFVQLQQNDGFGLGFLAGGVVRTVLLVVFLLFSIIFYQDPLDKSFVLGIISSYFVYYPVLLVCSVCLAIQSVRRFEREKEDRKNSEINRI